MNPLLGTHGYPDCVAGPQGVSDDVAANQVSVAARAARRARGGAEEG